MTISATSSAPQQSQSTSAQLRNAFLAAIAILAIAFLNLSGIATLAIETHQFDWRVGLELAAIIWLLLTAFIGLVRILNGHLDQSIWILIYTFLVVAAIRTALHENIGLPFGILTSSVIAATAYLALSQQHAGLATTVGFGAGAIIVLFDQYAGLFYTRQPAPAELVTATINLAGFAFLFQIVVIASQLRRLSMNTKLSNLFSSFTLLVALLLGVLGTQTLSNSLRKQKNEALEGSAKQIAFQIDTFIQSNLDSAEAEGQTPILSKYLLMRKPGAEFDLQLAKETSETLKAFKRKDPELIESYALLNFEGKNILDTNSTDIGRVELQNEYFKKPYSTGLAYMSPVLYSTNSDQPYFFFSSPVRDANNVILGVLRVRYNAQILQKFILKSTAMGGGESLAALVDENGVFLAHGTQSNLIMKSVFPLTADEILSLQKQGRLLPGETDDVLANFTSLADGLANSKQNPYFNAETHMSPQGIPQNLDAVAVAPLNNRPWKVLFSQSQTAFLSPVTDMRRNTITLAVFVVLIGTAVGFSLVRTMTKPIQQLTETAVNIAAGNLSTRASVVTEDEIGILAQSFNSMTGQLNDMVNQLEARVAERTQTLERHVMQLRASAEIGSIASSLRDLNSLLTETTRLIGERFGFYHAGIFLLDESGKYAVLRAANSPGGQRMLARGHRLRVGETGIVGNVTHLGKARIALDVGKDAIFFNNPDLPETRSEMALPLLAGGRILGALDVQSTQAGAFTEADIAILQVVADQIAIAVENARLFEENRAVLEATRRAFGELSQTAWSDRIRTSENIGFLRNSRGLVSPISGEWDTNLNEAARSGRVMRSEDGKTIGIPIKIRGQVVGAIRMSKPDDSIPWTGDEITTAETLSGQLGEALESARLYDEARQRADREQAISQVTTAVSSASTFDDILRTTVKEIGSFIGDSEIAIQILGETEFYSGHHPETG